MPEIEELTCKNLAAVLKGQEVVLFINTGKNKDYLEKVFRPIADSDVADVPMVEMSPDESPDCQGIAGEIKEHDRAVVVYKGEVVKVIEPTGDEQEDYKKLLEEVG